MSKRNRRELWPGQSERAAINIDALSAGRGEWGLMICA